MTLTMKADGTHQAPWVVVPDIGVEAQRAYIIELFGMHAASVEQLTTYEVFLEADAHHRAAYLASKGLGGRPVKASPYEAPIGAPVASEGPSGVDAAYAAVEQGKADEPAHPFQVVLDQIAAATSKRDLQKICTLNNQAFTNEDVAKAATEKVKALTA